MVTNGFWGSTYSINDPREEIGMPAFSSQNAFIVRVPPEEAALAEGTDLVCRLLPDGDEDNAVEVEMEREEDGSYVTSLIVPMLEIDGGTGLESVTNAVMLDIRSGATQKIRIEIYKLGQSAQKIAENQIPIKQSALFSALVTDEVNGRARASMAVVQAGETARQRLKHGVTPLFSPTKEQVNAMLKRHRVWVHSGHGDHCHGIEIVRQTGGEYIRSSLKASDITAGDLDYDLVFMNTCESTDMKYYPVFPVTPQACGGWDGPHAYTDGTAVLDIGLKLNAKNYVGWDCEVPRQLSVTIPRMLMEELDSQGTRQEDRRTVADAVQAVRSRLRNETPMKRAYLWYEARLRYIGNDMSSFDFPPASSQCNTGYWLAGTLRQRVSDTLSNQRQCCRSAGISSWGMAQLPVPDPDEPSDEGRADS